MTRLDTGSLWMMEGWRSQERSDVAAARPDAWNPRMEDLRAIRALDEDWDGQGAKAPSPALLNSAVQLADTLRQQGIDAPCRIVPGVNGTIIFEWQKDDIYREMEVTEPYRAEILEMAPGQPPKRWTVPTKEQE